MENLSALLSGLSLFIDTPPKESEDTTVELTPVPSVESDSSKRYLFAYCDTEGTPNRKDSKSNLRDFAMVFTSIIEHEGDSFKCVRDDLLHVVSWSCPSQIEFSHGKSIRSSLDIIHSTIDYLKTKYDADNVVLSFWNAPHDRSVLHMYNFLSEYITIDLLKWARLVCVKDKPESFALQKLVKHFDLDSGNLKSHNAFADSLMMKRVSENICKKHTENATLFECEVFAKIIKSRFLETQPVSNQK